MLFAACWSLAISQWIVSFSVSNCVCGLTSLCLGTQSSMCQQSLAHCLLLCLHAHDVYCVAILMILCAFLHTGFLLRTSFLVTA